MAAGNALLTDDERNRIELAVKQAEKYTGLQFLIYVGKSDRDTRIHAEKMMISRGYHEINGILIFVSPQRKALEVVTSTAARKRIGDEQAKRAVEIMIPAFRKGDWVSGVELGLSALAEDAGPLPSGESPAPDVPNIM